MTRQAVESRYNFTIPELYIQLEQDGRFSIANINRENLILSRYLYLPEVEWWSLSEIAGYQPPDYHKLGFVPFADNGAGDSSGYLTPTGNLLCLVEQKFCT